MAKLAVLAFSLVRCGQAQDCIKYGAPTTLRGALSLRDEAGYNQYTLLTLVRPVCAIGDPKDVDDPGSDYYRRQDGVKEIQAGVYGGEAETKQLRDRLRRLIGQSVVIGGDLFPAQTGYHRTNLQLRVTDVEAADPAGQTALLVPEIPFEAKDVAAYDVTIRAGKRLVLQARVTGSGDLLLPAEQYVSHWMTGGEVVYVYCRDGYHRTLIRTTERNGGICFDGDLCGFSAFPEKPVTIKVRCTRKR